MSTHRPRQTGEHDRPTIDSLQRWHDNHSASRRVDVLLEEAPHLLAAMHRRDVWNLRAALALALALLAAVAGYLLAELMYPRAAHVAYYAACLLVILAAIARAVATGEARR